MFKKAIRDIIIFFAGFISLPLFIYGVLLIVTSPVTFGVVTSYYINDICIGPVYAILYGGLVTLWIMFIGWLIIKTANLLATMVNE